MVPQKLHHYELLQALACLTVHVHGCVARRSRSPLEYTSHRTRENTIQLGECILTVEHHPRVPIARVGVSNLVQPVLREQRLGADALRFVVVLVGRPQQPVVICEAPLEPDWHIVVELPLSLFVEVLLRDIANESLIDHLT